MVFVITSVYLYYTLQIHGKYQFLSAWIPLVAFAQLLNSTVVIPALQQTSWPFSQLEYNSGMKNNFMICLLISGNN